MLGKYCSTFSKLGFNSTWTVNFQMLKLDLEKVEEPEIKMTTSIGSLLVLLFGFLLFTWKMVLRGLEKVWHVSEFSLQAGLPWWLKQ